jgi:hypothetical protein
VEEGEIWFGQKLPEKCKNSLFLGRYQGFCVDPEHGTVAYTPPISNIQSYRVLQHCNDITILCGFRNSIYLSLVMMSSGANDFLDISASFRLSYYQLGSKKPMRQCWQVVLSPQA